MEITSVSQQNTLIAEQSTAFEALKKAYPNYSDHKGLFDRIQKISKDMQQHAEEIYQLDVVGQHSDDFYVTGKDVYFLQREAGKGGQSSAFFVIQISLEDGQTKNMVIKVAQKAFKTEQDQLDCLSPKSKVSKNIDHFKGAYKIQNNSGHIALFEASRSDFIHIDYKNMRLPVLYATKQLLSVADGIASFHRADLVLRDIKGANFLANWKDVPGEEEPGKVTDFGLVKKLPPEGTKHSTNGTPTYMAPYIWDNIVDQKLRRGFQGKEADLFALGRTIQYDVILRLFETFGGARAYADINAFIKPRVISLQNMANENLLAYERSHPRHVFWIGGNKFKVFQDEKEVYQHTLNIIDEMGQHFSEDEREKLKDLAELARDLQATTKKKLLKTLGISNGNERDHLIQAVITRLKKIESSKPKVCTPKMSDQESTTTTTTTTTKQESKKRKGQDDSNNRIDPAPVKTSENNEEDSQKTILSEGSNSC